MPLSVRHDPLPLRMACFVSLLMTVFTASVHAQSIDFNTDIRPILADKCFRCHGPDERTREADLRLDLPGGLFGDLGGYHSVVPGDPDSSAMIERINAEDASERMPPPESNKSLSAEQRELLRSWVEHGAEWQQHWAFIPPLKSALPEAADDRWSMNEIDRFIVDRLTAAELAPSGQAEPYALVRRLYLDLVGLPPSPEEADRWVDAIWPMDATDAAGGGAEQATQKTHAPTAGRLAPLRSQDEAAYQQLVSHLLASPAYGERWARRWLDLARYADTNGYEKDRDRSIWPYRDWVVDALNADLPFDQFTIKQLAGDMLPGAMLAERIATGFHRNTMLNEEGGIDPLEFRYHAMTDRVATTGTTWLGLTLGCCQCHTHKFDPISHTEYYQIFALMNNADEPYLELPGADFESRWASNRKRAQQLVELLPSKWPVPDEAVGGDATAAAAGAENDRREELLEDAFSQWLVRERANLADWKALRPTEATANLPILTIEEDNAIFASGDTAKRDDYYLTFAPVDFPIRALQLEALPDERLPARGPGSTYYEGTLGDFYLTDLRASVAGRLYPFDSASETYAKNRYGTNPVSASLVIDADVQTGWSVHDRQGERHVAVFILKEPIAKQATLSIQMSFGRHFASSLGRFRFSASRTRGQPQARDYSPEIEALLARPEDELGEEERYRLRSEFLISAPELAKEAEEIRKLRARPEVPTSLVLSERPVEHPRTTYRHHRGEYLQPAEEVSPGLPAVLPGLPEGIEANRLSFARWLVSEGNPLTARVVVNRQWEAFFGSGLVTTVDDFGMQGQPPSHPELLDWLAVTFMQEDRWSLKQLHRRIVSSGVYRQSSARNLEAAAVDPANRLLSFMPRFRLDAEVIRDSLLVASGKLSREVGGPPVRPPQPPGITEVTFGSPKWDVSEGSGRYRRSLYTFIKRTAPFAMFSTFDAPSGESCTAQRTRSNSPLQALTLLNDILTVDLARAAAEEFSSPVDLESLETKGGLSQRIAELFRRVVVRPPSNDELKMLTEFYRRQLARFQTDPQAAAALTQIESDTGGKSLEQLAAWTATARAIFSLDESQTRE